ncbi:triose-phosphate isomerase [Candidatus Parcubacteria bacterium]|nr:triose-phosphate isomerase [Candidatus Parcubacteria bacterium]
MKKSLLVVANWKLHPQTLKEAQTLLSSYELPRGMSVAVCPPALFLQPLRKAHKGRIVFGGQNVFFEKEGPYTGELSAGMLKDAGASYVLVGHAERRALGEGDDVIARKVGAAARAGLTAILCVGERERDEHGFYLNHLKGQLEKGLAEITPLLLKNIVIAYEPIWAIGAPSAVAITPRDLQETTLYLRKILHSMYKDKGLLVPVLYGGSVTSENASSFVGTGEVNGLLVGRESLKGKSFNALLDILTHA